MIVEGIRYQRFVVSFVLDDGRRRRWIRWSPGPPWVAEEIARELHDKAVPIKRGSNLYIRQVD